MMETDHFHCNRMMKHVKKGYFQTLGFPEGWDENRKGGRGCSRGDFSTCGGRGGYGRGNGSSGVILTTSRANAIQGGAITMPDAVHLHNQAPHKFLLACLRIKHSK